MKPRTYRSTGRPHPRFTEPWYERSIKFPETMRDQIYELANRHERNFADEVRQGMRMYIEWCRRKEAMVQAKLEEEEQAA